MEIDGEEIEMESGEQDQPSAAAAVGERRPNISTLQSSRTNSRRRVGRRRSSVGASSVVSLSSLVGNGHMTETEQEDRRRRIKSIMQDDSLSQQEKSRSIQSLMDGRPRRCSVTSTAGQSIASVATQSTVHSYVSNMGPIAAAAVVGYYTEEQQAKASTPNTMVGREFLNYRDDRSVASVASSVSTSDSAAYLSDEEERGQSVQIAPPGVVYKQYHGRSLSLQEWKDTDRFTAAAQTTVCNPEGVSRLMEQSRPACDHYARNCTLISPCCGLAFGCRICHDDCPVLPPPVAKRRSSLVSGACPTHHSSKVGRRRSMPVDLQVDQEGEETHHLIDRFAVREVICRRCYTRQSSKTNNCIECGIKFGEYHCNICNLWMSASESPYHCTDCGFCRVGGRQNFQHCHDCGMCIDTNLFDDHNCKSGKYMSNCPICQEDLFSSRFASHEMSCGHAIHWHCFKELVTYDTRCPVCKKTAESREEMEVAWSTLAMGIALQPVPPDLARVVNLLCIDCETTEKNRRWHFLGVRCNSCLSFNTNVEQIVMQGPEAATFLDERERNAPVPMNITMPMRMDMGGDDAMDEDGDL